MTWCCMFSVGESEGASGCSVEEGLVHREIGKEGQNRGADHCEAVRLWNDIGHRA